MHTYGVFFEGEIWKCRRFKPAFIMATMGAAQQVVSTMLSANSSLFTHPDDIEKHKHSREVMATYPG